MSSTGSDSADFYDASPGDETLVGRSPRPGRPAAAPTSQSPSPIRAAAPREQQQQPQPQQQQQQLSAAGTRSRSHSRGRASAETIRLRRISSPPQKDVPPTPAIPARFLKDSRLGRPASIASQARIPLHAAAGNDVDESNNPPPALGSERRPSTSAAAVAAPAEVYVGAAQVSRPASRARCISTSSASRKRSSTSVLPSDKARINNAILLVASCAAPSSKSAAWNDNRALAEKQRPESLPTTPIVQVDVRTLSKLESRAPSQERRETTVMSRPTGGTRNGDLFIEVAADNDFDENMISDEEIGQRQRQRLRSSSRASYSGKRRSLPADIVVNNANDHRPSTSGHLYTRPSSRLHTNRASTDLQRHMDQYKSPTNRTTFTFGDNVSVSGQSNSGRSRRCSAAPNRSPASPSGLRERLHSPELSNYGRRRPSFGTTVTPSRTMEPLGESLGDEESPTADSDPKQADSTSNESQPAETVWDELDDLKSRIKSLEFNGQAHTSSSAAASGDSSDRPRTATTAPTTIDSSPKNVRKPQSESKKPTPTAPETASITKTIADIHPPLHTALEKARPLLNASLMRTLDATASDALQLAAITSSAGPQGTNYSAASIINGLTVSDRHVRRKVDNMCRNLTELCLALCEGKHEAPSVLASPAPMIETSMLDSPSIRYSSGNFAQRSSSTGRPMSRLEARKSSILGGNTIPFADNISPRGSVGDVSSGEQENIQNPAYLQQPRRVSRAPNSVFSSRQRQDDISGDEDSNNFRPPSRATTDVGALRSKSRITNENRSPAALRTPSLRESLTIKTNEAAFERNRDTPRITSIGSGGRRRRLFDNESTPPVMEKDDGPSEYNTPSQPRRRITSLGHYSNDQYSSRRPDLPGRTTSLSQRRHVIVE